MTQIGRTTASHPGDIECSILKNPCLLPIRGRKIVSLQEITPNIVNVPVKFR